MMLTYEHHRVRFSFRLTMWRNPDASGVCGWLVTGPSVRLGTAVDAVTDSTHVTLTKAPVPVTRISMTSIPPVVPAIGFDSITTAGSPTVTIPGGTPVIAGMTVTGTGFVPANTTVTAVTDVKSQINSTLTSGSADVRVPYMPLTPPLSPGNSVSGSTHLPAGTTISAISEVITVVKSTTVNGSTSASVPATPALAIGNIVRGAGIAPSPDPLNPIITTITAISSVTRSISTVTSNNSTVATVGYVAGGGLSIGSLVSGGGITPGTEISGIGDGNTDISAVTTVGSAAVTGVVTTNLAVGDPVSGSGIPANTTIAVIGPAANTLILSQNAAAPAATTLTFTQKRLTFSNVANPGGTGNLTYTIGRTLTLSRDAVATVAVPSDFSYLTELKLTLTNPTNATIVEPLDYTTARTITISRAAFVTGTNSLSYSPVLANNATKVIVRQHREPDRWHIRHRFWHSGEHDDHRRGRHDSHPLASGYCRRHEQPRILFPDRHADFQRQFRKLFVR